jgi:two-component system cell cycle sensor histidine kinase/response regulator CckA
MEDARRLRVFDAGAAGSFAATSRILEVFPDGIVLVDREGILRYLNRPAAAMVGRTEEIVGKRAWTALPEWLGEPLRVASERAMRQRMAVEVEVHHALAGRWLEGRIRPLEDGLVFFLVDVTERRRAEEGRRLYALIVEHATDFIALCAPDGRILYINEAGQRMVGLRDLEEARTKRVRDFLTPEGVQQSLEVELTSVLEKGHWEGSGQLVHLLTGERIEVETTSFAVPDPTTPDKPLCLATIRREVTARRALEEQLRQSQKMEVVGHLAAGIAHDFNNLLTIIAGTSEFLLEPGRLGEVAHTCVEEIDAAARRAAALTRQLLAFGRQQVLTRRVLDANQVIADTSKLLVRLLPTTVELRLDLNRAPLWVCADRSVLEQVLLNLVVNARDAMPSGGTVTIRTRAEGAHMVLFVRDTGTGMTSEVRARAFEPFFTTKAVGRGTGLGLSTVYGLVRQSGGDVSVESTQGAGSAFTVRLPLSAEPGEVAEPASRPLPARSGNRTLLVVDDEDAIRRTMKRILESAGYRVIEAGSAENALRICAAYSDAIDLLVTDLRMPTMDGRELTRRARELRPELPVLVVTGLPDDAPLPSDEVLAKPFSPGSLLRRVDELLAESR